MCFIDPTPKTLWDSNNMSSAIVRSRTQSPIQKKSSRTNHRNDDNNIFYVWAFNKNHSIVRRTRRRLCKPVVGGR